MSTIQIDDTAYSMRKGGIAYSNKLLILISGITCMFISFKSDIHNINIMWFHVIHKFSIYDYINVIKLQ